MFLASYVYVYMYIFKTSFPNQSDEKMSALVDDTRFWNSARLLSISMFFTNVFLITNFMFMYLFFILCTKYLNSVMLI